MYGLAHTYYYYTDCVIRFQKIVSKIDQLV